MSLSKKICILATDSSWGGTEKMIKTLIQGLSHSEYSISLVTLMGDDTLINQVKPFCLEVLNLKAKSIFDFKALIRLIRFLKRGHFGILHTFLFHANILGRVLGRLLGIPIIVSSQRSVDHWRKKYHVLLDRWTSRYCDLIISNSQAGKERLEQIEKISPQKIEVVYNGLDFSEIPKINEIKSSKKEMDFEDKKVIGMVANFRGMKGHACFIEMTEFLLKERSDLHFIFVGEGCEKVQYEEQVQKRGIALHFHFLGRVSLIYEALNLMDIFVLPSEWEGFPVSILEAMAWGIPVIATNVGGVPEIVEHEKTGFLIPPKNPLALNHAILEILKNDTLREKLIQNAQRRVKEQFTQEKMVLKTKSLYEYLVLKKGIL